MGRNVYIRDVATIADSTDVDYGYALVNGKKSVYLPIIKKDTASTLTVVADIYKSLHVFREPCPRISRSTTPSTNRPRSRTPFTALPPKAHRRRADRLDDPDFLRDLRSVVVVVLNIPLALTGSLVGLWLTGNTVNIMSLGGMALAIGMFVDEATVSIENIHVQMGHTKRLARAVERGSMQTAVPRLLAMMCILSVFIPAFIMVDPMRALFMPLALAVGFAMISSYLLSSTLVPIVCVYLLKHRSEEKAGSSPASRPTSSEPSDSRQHRLLVVPLYLVACGLVLWQVGMRTGTELFPQINSPDFVLRYRPPRGSNYEITRQMGVKILQLIEDEVGPRTSTSRSAMPDRSPPTSAWTTSCCSCAVRTTVGCGSDFATAPTSTWRSSERRCARSCRRRSFPGWPNCWKSTACCPKSPSNGPSRALFGFEPGNIISEVMSFGSATPIEVVVASPDLANARHHAQRIKQEMMKIPACATFSFSRRSNIRPSR